MTILGSIRTPAWATGFKLPTITCGYCQRSTALRNLSAHKAGIKMRGAWYCSSPCFTSAVQRELSQLLPPRLEEAGHTPRMPLGLSLIVRGLLTHAQLKEVTDGQEETGSELGELLVRHGLVNEKAITEVRAAEWNCPVFAAPRQMVQTGIRIPTAFLQIYSAIPLHYVPAKRLLLVGFVYRVEYALLYALEQMTGCKTQACFITPGDFETQIHQIARARLDDSSSKEVNVGIAQTPTEMAPTLCKFSIDFEADEARIARCKEYVWARLTCSSTDVDIIFRAG